MNFPLLMLLLLAITGFIWLIDMLFFAKQRDNNKKDPWWVEYSKSFFPVILLVFCLRSFLVEPFKIPSGSMIPTLIVGDFILVNKYTYGIRFPVVNKKLVSIGEPNRGDVMVFKYPVDKKIDYIKRVIGIPDDTVTYSDKNLFINGIRVKTENIDDDWKTSLSSQNKIRKNETLDGKLFRTQINRSTPAIRLSAVRSFQGRENCSFKMSGFSCKVPKGHYFVMGDSRDASSDSRYWGFVPEENIVGKAFFVWWNFNDLTRVGTQIK